MYILSRRLGRAGFVVGNVVLLLSALIYSQLSPAFLHEVLGYNVRFVLIASWIVLELLLTTWRCHDYNESFWSNWMDEQTPFVGPFLALGDLLFKPGSVGHNSYGPPPRF